jgi:hypothetical protein
MSDTRSRTTVPRSFTIIAGLAIAWNLIGVGSYLSTVMMSPETLAAMPEAQRDLQRNIPAWVTSAYAIAVFAGTLGSIALLLRTAWAVPLLIASLLGALVQMGHAFFATAMLSVMGASAAILPILIIVIGAYLVVYANSAKEKGWLA